MPRKGEVPKRKVLPDPKFTDEPAMMRRRLTKFINAVMLDGKIVLSCMILAVDARGKKITTVEGLADGQNLSPVQQAFAEKDALMCGFCTPGLVMSATALLHNNPNPNLDEIKEGLSGNLCRCGTYPKVFEAVQSAKKISRKGG